MNPQEKSILPKSTSWMLSILLCTLFCGCDGKKQEESDSLDQLLANTTTNIDTIQLGAIYTTNYLTGAHARLFLAALHKTNRIPVSVHGRVEVTGWVILKSNTNEVFYMGIFDGDTYTLGEYCFQMRTPPN